VAGPQSHFPLRLWLRLNLEPVFGAPLAASFTFRRSRGSACLWSIAATSL